METADVNGYTDLQQGATRACEDFVREHYQGVFRWFQWLANDIDRATDLTQETFFNFFDSLRRTTPSTSPKIWLFSIGRNVWRKHCRQKQRRKQEEAPPDDLPSGELNPYRNAEQQEFARSLQKEVENLPEDYREVFTLRVWQEMDYEEIADIQGISRDLARWRFFRARQMIQVQMKAWQLQEETHGS